VPEQAAPLQREAVLLVQRLRLWTPPRWGAAAPPWGSRADLVHHLAQVLANEAALLEGTPQRPLPHLPSPFALPDQLAVTADDLVRAGPTSHDAVLHLLAHRADLLGDAVPASLGAALGADDPVRAGRAICMAGAG